MLRIAGDTRVETGRLVRRLRVKSRDGGLRQVIVVEMDECGCILQIDSNHLWLN